jgi:hypothetical protein
MHVHGDEKSSCTSWFITLFRLLPMIYDTKQKHRKMEFIGTVRRGVCLLGASLGK